VTDVPRPISCPRCGQTVAPDQGWCLHCGAAARTRIAKTPRWRLPLIFAAIIAALALATIGYSFAKLTADAGRLADAPVTTAAPAGQPPAAQTTAPLPGTPATTATTPPLTQPPVQTATPPVTAAPETATGSTEPDAVPSLP